MKKLFGILIICCIFVSSCAPQQSAVREHDAKKEKKRIQADLNF